MDLPFQLLPANHTFYLSAGIGTQANAAIIGANTMMQSISLPDIPIRPGMQVGFILLGDGATILLDVHLYYYKFANVR